MGWMCSWVAVKSAAKGDLLEALSLVETGEVVEPGSGAVRMSCGVRPDGWVVLFSEDFDWGDRRRVLGLSRFGPTVGCQFEDGVEMTSIVSGAENGVELWRVAHRNDPKQLLEVSGEPPSELAAIRDRHFREQDGGDASSFDFIHDVPLELAKSVCGYRADEDEETVFVALDRLGAELQRRPAPRMSILDKLLAPLRPPPPGWPGTRDD
jgi:hypothetical protein